MKLLILVVLLALMVGFVALVKLLPWWGTLLLILGLIGVAKLTVGRLLRFLFLQPFKAKGRVLQNASVTVHSITPAEAPAAEQDEDGEIDADERKPAVLRRWFRLDATVIPQSSSGPFHHWAPGEIQLEDAAFSPSSIEDDDDESCEVKKIEVEDDGQFKPDEGMKYAGPLRFRLLAGVKPGIRSLRLKYYFERFGEVALPPG